MKNTGHVGDDFQLRIAETPEDFTACMTVRTAVFVDEQGVPPEAEEDDADHLETTVHVRIDQQGACIATGRLVEETMAGERVARIGRMAVLKEWRGRQLGCQIMLSLEEAARARQIRKAILHAQTHALRFYEKLGYVASGPIFDEEGIDHVFMAKTL